MTTSVLDRIESAVHAADSIEQAALHALSQLVYDHSEFTLKLQARLQEQYAPRYDDELSRTLYEKARSRPKECWWNARRALHHPYARRLPLHYVEGWCVMKDVPIVFEHGWLETDDGITVDPSLYHEEPHRYYVPAFTYPREQTVRFSRKRSNIGPIILHQQDGWPGVWNQRAWHEAWIKAEVCAGIPVQFLASLNPRNETILHEIVTRDYSDLL